MVGYLGYDVVRRLERIGAAPSATGGPTDGTSDGQADGGAVDELGVPELVMLLATDLAALDHHEGTVTLIANAVNWDASDERVDAAYDSAVQRLTAMSERLAAPISLPAAVFRHEQPEVTRRVESAEYRGDGRGCQGTHPSR